MWHGETHRAWEACFLMLRDERSWQSIGCVSYSSTFLSLWECRLSVPSASSTAQGRRQSLISHLLPLGTMRLKPVTSWEGRRGPGQALWHRALLASEEKPRLKGTDKATPTQNFPEHRAPCHGLMLPAVHWKAASKNNTGKEKEKISCKYPISIGFGFVLFCFLYNLVGYLIWSNCVVQEINHIKTPLNLTNDVRIILMCLYSKIKCLWEVSV